MNIYFDVEIHNPDIWDTCSIEEQTVLGTIGEFVEGRIIPLKDEIEREEEEGEQIQQLRAVVICLKDKMIKPIFYSDSLANKIASCFSPEDIEYMWSRVDNELSKVMN